MGDQAIQERLAAVLVADVVGSAQQMELDSHGRGLAGYAERRDQALRCRLFQDVS